MFFNFKNLIKFIILAGSIYYLSRNLDISKLFEIFQNTKNIIFLFFPIIFIIFQIYFGLIKHYVLVNYTQANKISFSTLLLPTLLSYLVDQISILGYFVIKLILLKNLKLKFSQIIFSSFFDKLSSFIIKIIFALPMILYLIINYQVFSNIIVIAIFIVVVFILILIFIFKKTLISKIKKLFSKYNIVYLNILLSKEFLLTLFLSLISHIFIFLAYISILYFLDINISDLKLIFLLPVAILVGALPVSVTPWFYRETSFVIILSYALIPNEGAIAMSLIFSIIHIVLLMITSTILFFYEVYYKKI